MVVVRCLILSHGEFLLGEAQLGIVCVESDQFAGHGLVLEQGGYGLFFALFSREELVGRASAVLEPLAL